jgi:hypothetical protein
MLGHFFGSCFTFLRELFGKWSCLLREVFGKASGKGLEIADENTTQVSSA